MIHLSGDLRKMPVSLQADKQATYQLLLIAEDKTRQLADLNLLLGKRLEINFSGAIHCIHCARKTKKSYSQGYCYPCFRDLAACDTCIFKPELCHYSQGTCREPAWGEEHCFAPHYVYLSNTSNLKIGITRQVNTPTRWIDQGAVAALPILQVNNRLASGLVETLIASQVSDRTAWQRMLKNQLVEVDLQVEAEKLLQEFLPQIEDVLAQQELPENLIAKLEAVPSLQRLNAELLEIEYPVLEYPSKITSLNLDKTPQVSGQLLGIKGQYLILDTGVINLRKYAGYRVEVKIS